jgi:cysteinyl-tRNA synthetase
MWHTDAMISIFGKSAPAPEIFLYNSLGKEKQRFTPLKGRYVKMYTCGPTVYDYVHIGNLRSFILAETLRGVR